MAERTDDVDQLTRAIVRYPQFRAALTECVALRRQRSSNSADSTPVDGGASSSSTARRERFEGTDQEFSHLFSSQRRQQQRRSSPLPSTRNFVCRQRVGHQRRRWEPRATGSRPKHVASTVCKEVVLLPDPKRDKVVRQSSKAALIEQGFVLSAFVIDKSWSEKSCTLLLRTDFVRSWSYKEGRFVGEDVCHDA